MTSSSEILSCSLWAEVLVLLLGWALVQFDASSVAEVVAPGRVIGALFVSLPLRKRAKR
jgi:hypothetical protein